VQETAGFSRFNLMPEFQQDAAGTDTRILQTRCTIRRQNFQTASRVRASVGNTFFNR